MRIIEPAPRRIFAIGDIHGCPAELALLLATLKVREGLTQQDQLVFIGDYIDRGPSSKAVLDLLLTVQRELPNTVFLMGNHEQMLLSYFGLGGSTGQVWLQNGGRETIKSYGIDPTLPADDVCNSMPEEHLDFLANLDRFVGIRDFIFVHAGLDPLRNLEQQVDDDIYWIRDPFIQNIHHFEKVVVFGHTPYQDVLVHLPYKIGIDTGLVYGNKLSCVELVNQEVFQVVRGGTEVLQTKLS